jgi:hypothetical protein
VKVRVRQLAITDLLKGGMRGSRGTNGMSRINLASMNQHLVEINRCVKPGAGALLIVDSAGWHCRRYGPSLNAQPQGPSAGTALARRLE